MSARTIRRVITGHDETGKAVVISDGPATSILQRPNRPGVTFSNLWRTDRTPAQAETHDDPVAGPTILHPPQNGTMLRVIQFDPENPDTLAKLDGKAAFAEMGAAANIVENARHPFMHRTQSIDYAIVLSGSITMLLDDSEVDLVAGDVLIQQGTNHAWSNQGTEPCLMAFVLIDAEKDKN